MRGLLGKTKPGSWRWVLGRMRLLLRVRGPAGTVIFGCHALLADSALCVSFLSCPRRRLSDPRLVTRLSMRGSSHRVRTKPWSPLLLFLSRLSSVPLCSLGQISHSSGAVGLILLGPAALDRPRHPPSQAVRSSAHTGRHSCDRPRLSPVPALPGTASVLQPVSSVLCPVSPPLRPSHQNQV